MAISFSNLGQMGRMGNQLFQYAALKGIAVKNNLEWRIPRPEISKKLQDGCHIHDVFELVSCSNENFEIEQPKQILYCETFNFIETLYNQCPDHSDLVGYFQTEKYFIEIENEIRKDFTFKKEILNVVKNFLNEIKNNNDNIFLHVRRGDNVGQDDMWGLCSLDYFKEAIDYYNKNINIIVISDDIDWCLKQDIFNSERFYFSNFSNQKEYWVFGDDKLSSVPYYDLCLMTLCSGGILSNSTLSWWGAWLIDNPKYSIIAPDPWFGPKATHNTIDLIPDRWVKLKK